MTAPKKNDHISPLSLWYTLTGPGPSYQNSALAIRTPRP